MEPLFLTHHQDLNMLFIAQEAYFIAYVMAIQKLLVIL